MNNKRRFVQQNGLFKPEAYVNSRVETSGHFSLMNKKLNFGDCMKAVSSGMKARRLAWEDVRIYIKLDKNGLLSIFKPEDNKLRPLLVSVGDLLGTDWVVI